jgi:hypothetical protein
MSELSPSTHPAGLQHWRKRLSQVTLPVLSPSASLSEALHPEVSVDRVLSLLEPDLPLGLAVIQEASRMMRKGRGEIRSLHHAIGMIGLTRVQAVLRSRMARRLDVHQPGHQAMAEAVAASRLGGLLAYYQALAARREDAEFRMWVTQLMGLASWKLPLADPAMAHVLATRVKAGERKSRVEQELLGCTMSELNRALLMDIDLTEESDLMMHADIEPRMLARAAKCAWVGVNAPEVPQSVGRWLFLPDVALGLMHMLAQEAMKDWFSKRTDTLLKACSALQHQRLHDTIVFSRQVAWHASQDECLQGWVVPALARVFWGPGPKRLRTLKVPDPVTRSKAAPAAVAIAPSPLSMQVGAPSRSQVQRFVAECEAHSFKDMPSFMKAFVDAMSQGLQLQRCALFLKTAQSPSLSCFLASGFNDSVGARKVTVQTDDDNLLARIYAHPSGYLWVAPHKLKSAKQQIPASLREHVLDGGLILGAVHVSSRPVGVLWADTGEPSRVIGESQYQGVKMVNRHFGEEFTRLMHLQRSQHRARPAN